MALAPALSATERNSTSTAGLWRLIGGPSSIRQRQRAPSRITRRCLPPGGRYAWPGSTASPSLASRTDIAEWRSRRSAKGVLNCAGRCWVITTAGASAGRPSSTTRRASVPPADAPMAIRRSVVRNWMERGTATGATASSVMRGGFGRDRGRTRERAAILTLAMISSA